jgi:seryl-tRNA synthetase
VLDIKLIRKDTEGVKKALARRGEPGSLDRLLAFDRERRGILTEAEALKSEKKKASEAIARMMREGKGTDSEVAVQKGISAKIKALDDKVGELEADIARILYTIPNMPHESVPQGGESRKNVIVKESESWKAPGFKMLPHWELGERLRIMEPAAASRMTGSNFVIFSGLGARLERALLNFMLDMHVKEHGYREIAPPYLVKRESMVGTGQLPKMEGDMYCCEADDLFMIPTAEVPLINMHREQVLDVEALPIRYVAYTPCFRREAGSYGKDTRGLIRIHQFDKVEMVSFTGPDDSYDELERMLGNAEEVLLKLQLPYRIVELCAEEISFASTKTYDIEVWAPGVERWLEVASISNCEDFQARRAGIRCKKKGSKGTFLPHTLNGSGVALPRTYIAILENYQNEDGTVRIPPALVPYMGGTAVMQ